jgi:hypothetical protein
MSDDKMQLEEVNQPESTPDKTSSVETPDEWSALSGDSQERFQSLANLKKEAERTAEKERADKEKLRIELDALKASQTRIPMPNPSGKMTPEEETAFKRLTDLGVANQDYVDRVVNEKVKVIEDRLYFDALHSRLEQDINSKKGMPEYNREEVETHMREKQIFDPKAAYNDLYHDEILTFELGQQTSKKQKVVQTEGTKSRISTTEPWTKASLAERLRQPDGIEFFRKNRDKILKMQSTLE